ncbi:MAG: hypothetical protein AAGP08_14555 [Pseudomonadota bacterium]
MTEFDHKDIDMIAIEDEARQLRAEAMKYGVGEAKKAVKAAFARVFGGSTQTA